MNNCQVSSAPRPGAESLVELVRDRADRGADGWSLGFLREDAASVPALDDGALDGQARAIAAALQAVSAPGERALLLYPPGPEFLAAFFGCLYAGVLAVPVNVPARNRLFGRVEAVAADAQVAVVLTAASAGYVGRSFIRDSPVLGALPWLLTDEPGLPAPAAWRPHRPAAGDLAFLQYTSGSTGTPRGVMVSHANLMYEMEEMAAVWQVEAGSVLVTWLPQFHDLGLIYGLLLPVYAGIPCHAMAPAAFVQRPWRWLAALARHGATHSAGPNFAYDLCVQKVAPEERRGLDLSRWRMAMNGAEPIRLATLERFAAAFGPQGFSPAAFCPAYGLAEGTLALTANPTGEAPRTLYLDATELQRGRAVAGRPGGPGLTPVVGCGAPLPGLDLCIVDPETGADCPADRIGEVWVAGPSVARGYWGRPEETAATFGARRAAGGATPYLRTGDLGFLRAGELYVTGRLKELLILRGANHYPQDVEAAAQASHPALRLNGGAAFSVEAGGEERLVLVQEIERVHRKSCKEAPGPVFAAIRRAIAEAFDLRVHAIALLEPGALLRTSSGKIQRAANRELFLAGAPDAVAVWSASAADEAADGAAPAGTAGAAGARPPLGEAALCRYLCEWLARRTATPLAEIAAAEPFASCGLDSVSAVELSRDVEILLGRPQPETLAWDHPSPAALAAHLAGRPAAGAAAPTIGRSPLAAPAGAAVAVVGLACRMPGAPDAERFWRLLADGVDAVTEVPRTRWDSAAVAASHPAGGIAGSPRWGGFLDGIDRFDAEFFGISPREARSMDPQQRLLLEVAWEALEDAGRAARRSPAAGPASSSAPVTATIRCACVPRGSPPSTACSPPARVQHRPPAGSPTSSACAARAWRSTPPARRRWSPSTCLPEPAPRRVRPGAGRRRQPDARAPIYSVAFARAGMLAPDGRCKTFDAGGRRLRARRGLRRRGAQAAVRRRRATATAILARDPRLRGQPGRPQQRPDRAQRPGAGGGDRAPRWPTRGVAPPAVDYVEAHGTGTALGDPIEMRALGEVFGAGRDGRRPPAGRLGQDQHRPPRGRRRHRRPDQGGCSRCSTARSRRSLHFRTPNRRDPAGPTCRSRVPTAADALAGGAAAAPLAGVSSFGFGGTNAHVVLEGPPPPAAAPVPATEERPRHLLALSAPSPQALADLAAAWADRLAGASPRRLRHSRRPLLQRRRRPHPPPTAGRSPARPRPRSPPLCASIRHPGRHTGRRRPDGRRSPSSSPARAPSRPPWAGELYATQPAFRRALERCDALLQPLLGGSLARAALWRGGRHRRHHRRGRRPRRHRLGPARPLRRRVRARRRSGAPGGSSPPQSSATASASTPRRPPPGSSPWRTPSLWSPLAAG